MLRPGKSPRFTLLLALSPEVAAVELRSGTTVLKRLVRQDKPPVIRAAAVSEEGTLTWSFSRVVSGPVHVGVEFLSAGVWAPLLLDVDSCSGEAPLPFHRIRRAERLRLFVSDGWRAAVRELEVPEGAGFGPLVIRRVSDHEFWADGADGLTFAWSRTAGGHADGRHFTVSSAAFAGPLTLHATASDGKEIIDRRRFGEDA